MALRAIVCRSANKRAIARSAIARSAIARSAIARQRVRKLGLARDDRSLGRHVSRLSRLIKSSGEN
ncbi:MAG: hypothetical protein F6J93_01220 [Oscillatoria sp. SIO1A7]|nr:hypothetical protein [Oscillatoria sp. SIO1A7]